MPKMPLYADAGLLIRRNLEQIRKAARVRIVPIGALTEEQLGQINAGRFANSLNPIISEVVFVGAHIYKSRAIRDGYTIEDVVDQISAAMDTTAVVIDALHMTIMESTNLRADRYGNLVRDRIVFECSARHPRAELFSVMPKGDMHKPPK